jgi:hypothetical protein
VRLTLAALLAAIALPIAGADAATYTVWSCKKPDGRPAPVEGWAAAGGLASTTLCDGGGPLRAGFDGTPPDTESLLTFTAPSGSKIAAYLIYRSVALSGAGYEWRHYEDPPNVYDSCGNPCGRGDRAAALSEKNTLARAGLNLSAVRFRVNCVNTGTPEAPQPCPAATPPTEAAALAEVHRAAFQLTDDTIPEFVGAPSGTLLDGSRPHSGVISASFSAKDTGSGVFEALVEVDGAIQSRQVADANGGRCAEPFVALKPCRETAAGTIALDTARIPNGRHDVRLLVTDATGANRTAVGPVAITVDNSGGRGTPNGSGPADAAKLTAGFRGRRSKTLTVPMGKRVLVEGRLTDTAGRAITNATLDVAGVERRLGATEQMLAQTVTGADGRFKVTITGQPGRKLIVRYRAFSADTKPAASAELALKVRASASFKISSRNVRPPKKVTFSGALRGGAIPPGGKIVFLQVFQNGTWRTFRDLRTDRKGNFRFVYSFKRRVKLSLRWRMRVRRDASYPYETGTSRAYSMRVRG